MKKIILFSFFILLSFTNCFAQGEANIWYFGNNAGLDFNFNPPLPLLNGQLNTNEGCASVADKNGTLLFYTDGITVWNKNHTPMPNGTGLFGHSSSTHSATIVPYPGTYNHAAKRFNKYYIITVDKTNNNNGGTKGTCYSEVDMTLNGGLGDVTAIKNVHLYDTFTTTEKICVVQHSNKCDYWVVGIPADIPDYYAYPITSAGFDTTPVVSVGTMLDWGIGQIKVSSDNKMIAVSHSPQLLVYDFDNSTGTLSLMFSQSSISSYGVEFSPNNHFLYVGSGELYQYDLLAPDNNTFVNSRQTISAAPQFSLQLASNGKIYSGNQDTVLGVINNPDVLGVGCNYVLGQQSLAGATTVFGLPSLVKSLIRPVNKIILSNDSGSCVQQSVTFSVLDTSDITMHNWNVAHITTPNVSLYSSNDLNPIVPVDSAGDYIISVIADYGCYADTLIDTFNLSPLQPPSINLTSTSVTCFGLDNGTINAIVYGSALPYSYLWSNAATTDTLNNLAPGIYILTVTDSNYCTAHDTVAITAPTQLSIAFSVEDVACNSGNDGKAATTVSGGTQPYSYSWSSGGTTDTAYTLAAGDYILTVSDSNNCTATDTATVQEPSAISVVITPTPTDCDTASGTATAVPANGNSPYSYSWTTSPPQATATATGLDVGTYTVTVTDVNGCTQTEQVSISPKTGATVSVAANPTIINQSEVVQLLAAGMGDYLWTPATALSCIDCQSPTASPQHSTTYCVMLTDSSGCTDSACITITVEIPCGKLEVPTAFSPNGDGHNDLFVLQGLGNCVESFSFMIFDRWGEKVFETANVAAVWDGTYKGKPLNPAVFVYYIDAMLASGEKLTRKGNISLIQ